MFKIRKDVMSYIHHYFCHKDSNLAAFNFEVAKEIDMTTDDFEKIMIKNHNAFINPKSGYICFENYSDAQNALDYVNSIILMKKLSQEK